ncbi:MAG: ring-cleaving dioxygenase [Trueperaceae bacterium]
MQPHGIHHLTAVSADVRDNKRFCTEVLGLRLVKRSVNQDDVSAYHLFYADGAGSPGTDLTFFDWDVPRERRGGHAFERTGLRVRDAATLHAWEARLREHGVDLDAPREIDGRWELPFRDPEGQRYALVVDDGRGDDPVPWEHGPVPSDQQIRGLGPVQATVRATGPSEALLVDAFGLRHDRSYLRDGHDVHVYAMGDGGAHAELHLRIDPTIDIARPGAGGVHHLALRVHDQDYEAWARRLNDAGVPNSGPVDRFWFRSLYARDRNGLLFELATDGPGFAVDEDPATLGETVVLPPFLEARRDQIVSGLTPLD